MNCAAPPLHTRARRNDASTSKEAARASHSQKAMSERLAIFLSVSMGSKTAREIAADTGIDYITIQRRISEVTGIVKTDEARDGCRVWKAVI